jgi:tellurite methyltransferase
MVSGGYDQGYLACSCFWGEKPAEMVSKAIEIFNGGKGRRALDLGCGEGKNAVALAKAGFRVVAIDKSSIAINNAMHAFGKADVNWLVCDLTEISGPPESYDLIIATGSLHCLKSPEAIETMISRIQKMTKMSGINVISSFNDGPQDMNGHDSDFFPTLISHSRFVELYQGWNMLKETNEIQKDIHPHNHVGHSHSITRILAQRRL